MLHLGQKIKESEVFLMGNGFGFKIKNIPLRDEVVKTFLS